jgi:hypothetical protein
MPAAHHTNLRASRSHTIAGPVPGLLMPGYATARHTFLHPDALLISYTSINVQRPEQGHTQVNTRNSHDSHRHVHVYKPGASLGICSSNRRTRQPMRKTSVHTTKHTGSRASAVGTAIWLGTCQQPLADPMLVAWAHHPPTAGPQPPDWRGSAKHTT